MSRNLSVKGCNSSNITVKGGFGVGNRQLSCLQLGSETVDSVEDTLTLAVLVQNLPVNGPSGVLISASKTVGSKRELDYELVGAQSWALTEVLFK
jgi:hypothetical protein